MINAWSLAYDVLNGTIDKEYPIMSEGQKIPGRDVSDIAYGGLMPEDGQPFRQDFLADNDDNAAHPGLAAAEWIAGAGAELEIITPERFFGADIGGLNHVAYAEVFDRCGVKITISKRLKAVRWDGAGLVAHIGSDFSSRIEERRVDQVVVEPGTLPLDDLYFALKPESLNLGEVDYASLIDGKPQELRTNPEGAFRMFRIGDAVSSRNIHAAIYDALRLCITL